MDGERLKLEKLHRVKPEGSWKPRTRARLNLPDWLDCEFGFHRKLGFAKFESRAPKVPTAIERQ
jgi:hypothetical protein